MNEVQKALELWVELTGLDPNAKSFRLRDMDIRRINEELKESLELNDPSYLTTLMLLNYYTTQYLDERSFSVNELLSSYDRVFDYLEKSKELYSILQSEDLQAQVSEFQSWLMTALRHYQVENQKVYDMMNAQGALAVLRRDAIRSMERLELHQFYQGDSNGSQKARYVTKVHEFWNINSLIRAMYSDKTLSGVSLNLIRDPVGTSSYFVFCIKNGQTISILTDKPNEAHPLQKYMTRRPGKELSERMGRHHFPYGLLELDFDYRGDAYFRPRETDEVVVYQDKLHPLKELRELEPDEVIWVILMFSMIEEKFWKQNFRTKELSYTGDMVIHQDPSTNPMTAIVPVSEGKSYKGLMVAPLNAKDVSTDNMLDEWEMTPTQQNRWLEERYEHLVPDHVLNLVGDSSTIPLLTDGNKVQQVTVQEYEESTQFMSKTKLVGHKLVALDSTSFGSQKEVVSNQRWVARYNKAVMIGREANKEFQARKDEVENTYQKLIYANSKKLLEAIAKGELIAPTHQWKRVGFGDEEAVTLHNMLTVRMVDERNSLGSWNCLKLPTPNWTGPYKCFVNDGIASISGIFRPTTAEGLAIVCGCEVSDLPDVLQYWTKADFYSGNSILDRIDPMEWVIKNPWLKLNFDVEVFLSKRAYNELRKEHGLPPNKFWLVAE